MIQYKWAFIYIAHITSYHLTFPAKWKSNDMCDKRVEWCLWSDDPLNNLRLNKEAGNSDYCTFIDWHVWLYSGLFVFSCQSKWADSDECNTNFVLAATTVREDLFYLRKLCLYQFTFSFFHFASNFINRIDEHDDKMMAKWCNWCYLDKIEITIYNQNYITPNIFC